MDQNIVIVISSIIPIKITIN